MSQKNSRNYVIRIFFIYILLMCYILYKPMGRQTNTYVTIILALYTVYTYHQVFPPPMLLPGGQEVQSGFLLLAIKLVTSGSFVGLSSSLPGGQNPQRLDNQGSEAWEFGGDAYLYIADKAESAGVCDVSSSKLLQQVQDILMGRKNMEGDLRDVGTLHPRY